MLTLFTIPVVMTMGNFIVEPYGYIFGLTVLFVVGVRYTTIEGILKGSPVVESTGADDKISPVHPTMSCSWV